MKAFPANQTFFSKFQNLSKKLQEDQRSFRNGCTSCDSESEISTNSKWFCIKKPQVFPLSLKNQNL